MSPLTPKTPGQQKDQHSQTTFFANSHPVQAKLTVNEPGDAQEKEADAMADQVMCKADDGAIRRKCAHCEEEENKVQRKADGDGGQISPQLASKLEASRGRGTAMPGETRGFMENAFGADFSGVNIHTGADAADMSRQIQAKAFTHGSDIYFNEGHYNPSSDTGKHLLAHELTHVIQQGKSNARQPARKISGEMLPGYSRQYGASLSNTSAPVIQRAKIDHTTLTWADFKGNVPKAPKYDAETYSHFRDFDMSTYPFKTLTEEETGTTIQSGKKTVDCEKGMSKDKKAADHPEKYKAFKVNIEPADISKLEVKSFMWQEKSWVKKWFHDPVARAAHADTFVPSCEKNFTKATKAAEKSCAKLVSQCEKAFKKGSPSFDLDNGASATSAAECKTTIKDSCVSDSMSTVTYSYKNHNDVSADASQFDDCATTFRQQMIDTVLEDSSTSLLNHEQRHFDITDEVAKKITSDLQSLASSFPVKEVEACGQGNAKKAAEKELKSQRAKLTKKMDAIKKTWGTYQSNYDSETGHSVNVKAQDWWNSNIDAGLPKKSGKKDKFKI